MIWYDLEDSGAAFGTAYPGAFGMSRNVIILYGLRHVGRGPQGQSYNDTRLLVIVLGDQGSQVYTIHYLPYHTNCGRTWLEAKNTYGSAANAAPRRTSRGCT